MDQKARIWQSLMILAYTEHLKHTIGQLQLSKVMFAPFYEFYAY